MEDHTLIQRKLSEYLDEMLSANERHMLEEHLQQCSACKTFLEELRKTKSLIGAMRTPAPPGELPDTIMAQICAEAARTQKRPFYKRLLYPLPVKIPLQAAALIVIAITGYYIANMQKDVGLQTHLETPEAAPASPAPAAESASPASPLPPATSTPAPEAPEIKGNSRRNELQSRQSPAPPAPLPPVPVQEPTAGAAVPERKSFGLSDSMEAPAEGYSQFESDRKAEEDHAAAPPAAKAAPIARERYPSNQLQYQSEPSLQKEKALQPSIAQGMQSEKPQETAFTLMVDDPAHVDQEIRKAAKEAGGAILARPDEETYLVRLPARKWESFIAKMGKIGSITNRALPPAQDQDVIVRIKVIGTM